MRTNQLSARGWTEPAYLMMLSLMKNSAQLTRILGMWHTMKTITMQMRTTERFISLWMQELLFR